MTAQGKRSAALGLRRRIETLPFTLKGFPNLDEHLSNPFRVQIICGVSLVPRVTLRPSTSSGAQLTLG